MAKTLTDGTVSINEEWLSRKWVNEPGLDEQEERIEFKNNSDILNIVKKYGAYTAYEAVKHYYLYYQDSSPPPACLAPEHHNDIHI